MKAIKSLSEFLDRHAENDAFTEKTCAKLNDFGDKLAKEGKWTGSVNVWNELLKLQRKELGYDHPYTAATLNNLGFALSKMGEAYDYNALTAFQEALKIRQKCLGPGHSDTADTANNMWTLLHNMRERQEWGGLLRQQRKELGDDHPDVASTLNDFAVVLGQMGEAYEDKALKLFEEALRIRQKTLGPGHKDTVVTASKTWKLVNDMRERKLGNKPAIDDFIRRSASTA